MLSFKGSYIALLSAEKHPKLYGVHITTWEGGRTGIFLMERGRSEIKGVRKNSYEITSLGCCTRRPGRSASVDTRKFILKYLRPRDRKDKQEPNVSLEILSLSMVQICFSNQRDILLKPVWISDSTVGPCLMAKTFYGKVITSFMRASLILKIK